jgi:hypothetical protein
MMNILKLSAFFALCAMLVIGLVACGDDDVRLTLMTVQRTISLTLS